MLLVSVWFLTGGQSFAASIEPEIVPQLVHSDRIYAVAVTPDGQYAASGSADKTIKLWHLATGALVRTFEGKDEINSVAMTPDGRHVVSGGSDGTTQLWDMETGALVRTFGGTFWLLGNQMSVNSVAVSPDGQRIVSGGYDGTIKVWDLATGLLVRAIDGDQGLVRSVAVTPDGRHIVSGGYFGAVKLWDMATGKLVRTMVGHKEEVASVAVTPDGRRIVSGSSDGTVKLWDIATGALARSFEVGDGDARTVALTFDGKHLVSGGTEIKILDIATGAIASPFKGFIGTNAISLTPDGRSIVSVDRSVSLLDMATGNLMRTFGSRVDSVALSPDGRYAMSGSYPTFKLWNPTSGAVVQVFKADNPTFALTPDGRHFLTEGYESIELRDLATGSLVRSFENHQTIVRSIVVTPDGRYVLSVGLDGAIPLWDLETGALVRTLESTQDVYAIAITPDSRYIVAGSEDSIKLWNLATGALVHTFQDPHRLVFAVAVTPDGQHIVSGSDEYTFLKLSDIVSSKRDHTIKLWDIGTGALVRTFAGHQELVSAIAVTPDGRRIVSGSNDKTAKVWDLETGALVGSFEGHQALVKSVAVTPDGRQVLSSSEDGTIRVWDLTSRRPLATLVGADGGTLALTPDGFFTLDGENKGATLLKVVDGLKVYDVRQFYQALYRPELVSELLKGVVSSKYEAAVGDLNLRKVLDSGPAPRLELKRSERVGDSVKVTVEITDAGGGIGKVEWRVNDVLLDGERGMTPIGENESVLTEIRSFPLTVGGNVIAVTAYNKAGLITAAPLVEKVDGQGIAETDKSRLFILSVGINDYAQSDLQLTNAVNDAEAFSSRFKTAAEALGLFRQVSVKTMINGEVTREGLDRAFTELAAEMGPDDKFAFFAAGHGKVYKDRYYFYPQDLHFGSGDAIISQGIDQATWQTWFSRIPARASVLIYDTCEAGQMTMAMRGSEDIRTAVDLLKNATGRSVLAATTSEDVAREGFEDHGVFTYALLKGLSEGDQNDDGRIDVAELGQYVERTVPELTEKRWGIAQRPRFMITANFPIAARVAPDGDAGAFIPKAATHVLIKHVTVASADRGASADKGDLQPGTTVRLLGIDGNRALIARDGKELGFVPAEALAPLN